MRHPLRSNAGQSYCSLGLCTVQKYPTRFDMFSLRSQCRVLFARSSQTLARCIGSAHINVDGHLPSINWRTRNPRVLPVRDTWT